MRTVLAIGTLLLAAGFSAPVQADYLRCGSKLVRQGATRAEVLNHCGEPADVQTRSIVRRATFVRGGRTFFAGDDFVEIPIEIWTYNFGPYKLLRRIRFIDGLVDEIETLGYGYRETPR